MPPADWMAAISCCPLRIQRTRAEVDQSCRPGVAGTASSPQPTLCSTFAPFHLRSQMLLDPQSNPHAPCPSSAAMAEPRKRRPRTARAAPDKLSRSYFSEKRYRYRYSTPYRRFRVVLACSVFGLLVLYLLCWFCLLALRALLCVALRCLAFVLCVPVGMSIVPAAWAWSAALRQLFVCRSRELSYRQMPLLGSGWFHV